MTCACSAFGGIYSQLNQNDAAITVYEGLEPIFKSFSIRFRAKTARSFFGFREALKLNRSLLLDPMLASSVMSVPSSPSLHT